jgi:malonyl-CoA/methylmalonyl-CoA synthetase
MTASNANLYAHFQARFHSHGDALALASCRGLTLSYRELDERAAQLARALAQLGLQPGDRVSAQVEKSPQALFLYLACLRGGFVFHPLNPGYTPSEMAFFLGDAEPRLLVCDPENESALSRHCDEAGVAHRLTLDRQGHGSLTALASGVPAEYPVIHREKEDLACLLYSSGTTGRPKGIMLSHDNLLSNAQTLVECWGFTDQDVLLHALPIFHVHGLFVALGCAFLSGAGLRWLPAFDVNAVLAELPHSNCMMGVPTYYTRLLADPRFQRDAVASMRLFVSGSAPLTEESFHAFEARTGMRILERYGMTETGMNTANPLHGERRPGWVGPALPGIEVRVVGEGGEELPRGSIGSLQVRGRNVFQGYWRLPEKTAADFTADGFFNTGDTGCIDGQGYVQIVGRTKDLIITGGLNVYPREVEALLDAQPAVLDSAVIGVPHPDFGEAVVAVVVPARGGDDIDEAALRRALREQLSAFKIPKRVVTLPALPRNSMGKVQKNQLREQFRGLFATA